ncbi:MAG: FMN-binding protein [Pirellulaceae bacterium]|nr:FMN-binding protein [Pirellulaceae bacterium]
MSLGVVCSLAIVTVYEVTRPIIERNKIALRQNAIGDVLPRATTVATYRLDDATGQFQPTSTDTTSSDFVYAGFDRHGELVGLAIETRGMGYQDFIGLLYGYSLDEQAIIGVRVLESRETPGLGDRVETDADFSSNFRRLGVGLNSDGTQLAHPIEYVKQGKKTANWQIDGITGATISSRAVVEMLRDSTAYWIPRVYRRRTDFAHPQSKEQ